VYVCAVVPAPGLSLVDQGGAYPFMAAFPLSQLPTVSCTYIACAGDRLVDPDWQVQTARNIGATLEIIPSSHSPFFSQPGALTDALLRVVAAN
jgi:pimeloyl-ACP methyl ester carboxylesterase